MCPEAYNNLRSFDLKGVPELTRDKDLSEWGRGDEVYQADLRAEIDSLKERISNLESMFGDVHEVRDIPKDAIREIIIDHAHSLPKGTEIYPSDIAYEYCLDADVVEEVMDELLEEGFFR